MQPCRLRDHQAPSWEAAKLHWAVANWMREENSSKTSCVGVRSLLYRGIQGNDTIGLGYCWFVTEHSCVQQLNRSMISKRVDYIQERIAMCGRVIQECKMNGTQDESYVSVLNRYATLLRQVCFVQELLVERLDSREDVMLMTAHDVSRPSCYHTKAYWKRYEAKHRKRDRKQRKNLDSKASTTRSDKTSL